MTYDFAKYHGIGNDFILINGLNKEIDVTPETVARLCERNFGIGADGVIVVRPSGVADYFMDYYNSDGSIAEMCGNGIRCFAKYVWDETISDATQLNIETRAGIKEVRIVSENGIAVGASVDMGIPILEPSKIPVVFDGDRVVDQPFTVGEDCFRATCVSMGNPHCVLFVDDVMSAPVTTLGSHIELSPMFPQKTNVEFAQIIDDATILLRVWERGCGETLACGTGACATAVAAVLNGKTERVVNIRLLGGELQIHWMDDDRVVMTGPAVRVFQGTVTI